MAKKIRMTFKTSKQAEIGDNKTYTMHDEISIVGKPKDLFVMTDVASYMIEHAEGFDGYSVEAFEEES